MAINPYTIYPTRVDAPSSDYPYGGARNESTSGTNDGTPMETTWLKDLWGLLQGLLKAENVTPTGNPDTATLSQYLQCLQAAIAGADFYTTGGTANAVFLTATGDRTAPAAYRNGQRIRYKAAGANTVENITVDVAALGITSLHLGFLENGETPTVPVGAIAEGAIIEAIHQTTDDAATDYFRIIGGIDKIENGFDSVALLPQGFKGADTTGTGAYSEIITNVAGRGIDYTGGPGDVDPMRIRTSIFDASAVWNTGWAQDGSSPVYKNTTNLTLTGIPYSAVSKAMKTFVRYTVGLANRVHICPAYCNFQDSGAGILEVDQCTILGADPGVGGFQELVIEYDATGV